jgi:hypothetical protein
MIGLPLMSIGYKEKRRKLTKIGYDPFGDKNYKIIKLLVTYTKTYHVLTI